MPHTMLSHCSSSTTSGSSHSVTLRYSMESRLGSATQRRLGAYGLKPPVDVSSSPKLPKRRRSLSSIKLNRERERGGTGHITTHASSERQTAQRRT
jgi:hypothetical protein